ncbi:hypothetical protein ACQY0O_001115 [Thecaphora frezii]
MKRQAARQMRRQDADDDGDDDDHQQQGLQPVAPPNPFASFGGFNKPLTTTPAPSQGNKDGATASLGDTVSSPPSTAVASVSTATTAFASTSKLASVPASASAFSASGHASPPSNNGSTAASNGDATSQQQKRRWTAVRGLNLSLQKALVRQIEQRLSCDAFADLSEVLREAERQYSQFRNEAELKHTPKSNAVDGDKEAHVTGFAFTPLNAPSSAASSDKQHKDEEHKKDGDKQEPNPDTASKPPTFSLPAAGFTFGGKAVSSPSGASSSASGEAGPKFDLPKGGFSFAGQPISSTPPSTSSSEPKPTSTSGAGSSPHRFAFGSFASSTNQSETHPNPKPPAPAFATPFANTDGVQKPGSFLFGNGSISFGEKK